MKKELGLNLRKINQVLLIILAISGLCSLFIIIIDSEVYKCILGFSKPQDARCIETFIGSEPWYIINSLFSIANLRFWILMVFIESLILIIAINSIEFSRKKITHPSS